jgi:hypothetical protein
MPEKISVQPSDDLDLLERLLEQQHDALLDDDFDAVETISNEIVAITTVLKASNSLPTGDCLERIRMLNEKMMHLLAAKQGLITAEMVTTRNRRDLNRSYRTHEV